MTKSLELMTDKDFMEALKTAIVPGMGAKAAATEVYKVCCLAAESQGQKPSIEVGLKGPSDHHYAGKCWLVCWEAGPYQWGIEASFVLMDAGKRLVEPYYSFDVCFYDNE